MSRLQSLVILGCFSALGCDVEPPPPAADACEEAASILDACGADAQPPPVEGCVGELEAAANEVIESGCAAPDGSDGKADSFWCSAATRWLGLCRDVPLEEVAAIPSVDDICDSNSSALCRALRDANVSDARAEVATQVTDDDRETVLRDPAVRLYLRERVMSLFAFNVVGRTAEPSDYDDRVQGVIAEHFPAYDPSIFTMARRWAPPVSSECEAPTSAVLLFPGVVRFLDRAEFAEQREAIESALPCTKTYLVDSGSFVDPKINAQKARELVDDIDDELGDVPLHLVGYSQGSTNALRTLVDHPDVARRTSTLLVMNAAAHGSEVADMLGGLLSGGGCEAAPAIARPTCEWAAARSPVPSDLVLKTLAAAMGIPIDQLNGFIAAEDGVAPAPDLRSFFEQHGPGVRSLTSEYADEFWSDAADRLPQDILYYSFRAAISDEDQNLPFSNALFHSLLERAGEEVPYNDMQVRLENQSLKGSVADVEILGPVAEGNHWQWQLATGVVPETVMPAHMTERIPHREILVAYFQALDEVGLLANAGE